MSSSSESLISSEGAVNRWEMVLANVLVLGGLSVAGVVVEVDLGCMTCMRGVTAAAKEAVKGVDAAVLGVLANVFLLLAAFFCK